MTNFGPQNAGLPQDLDLGGGYTVEFTALDASAGTDVTTVKVSLATLTIENVSALGDGIDLSSGPFMLVPGPES